MVTTLTLNPCIDKSVYVNKFEFGGMNRVISSRMDIAGKSINVSKVLHNLGLETVCIGINYSQNGNLLEEELCNSGIKYDFVTADGKIRTNIKLYDANNIMTEINESGDRVSESDIKNLFNKVESIIAQTDILVLSGSVPCGVDENIYSELIKMAKKAGAVTILDAEKELLTLGIAACPDIIKPNLYELESAFGVKLSTKEEIVALSKKIIAGGIKTVCVSMGGEGAIIVCKNAAFYAPPLNITVKGCTGAGDSMVAGICHALIKNETEGDILRAAVAAATGSLEKEGTILCDRKDFEKHLKNTEIIRI